MDAAAEKLTALKKAYADIILSISKEAAARVMASERKSVRYQHELKVAKEEGVRMLMRLKQMMDSQVSEAEAMSFNQQKKIEVLEAQLQEAEDIVRDLREELGEVQAELERIKSEDSNNLNESYSKEVPVENNNNISSYHSCKFVLPDQSSLGSDARGVYIRNRDLPSIIVRGKDPGLYRNGCTQRIRACERNALDRDLCLSVETHKVKGAKNGGEQKEEAKMLSELEKKLLADVNLGTFRSFSRKKKRAVRQRKTVMVSGGKQSCPSMKHDQLPEHSLASEAISVDNNARSAEDPSCLTNFQDKAELQTQLSAEKDSENERNVMEIDGAKTMCQDEGESKRVEPFEGVTGVSEGSLSPDCKKNVEKVDVPLPSLESNLSATAIGERVIKITFQRKRKRQALSGNVTNDIGEAEKKTGEGKDGESKLEQPKASLVEESMGEHRQCGSEVNGSCETEKRTVEQKVEQPKSSSSSRDRRRLAQVARQLISLSEKKWWH